MLRSQEQRARIIPGKQKRLNQTHNSGTCDQHLHQNHTRERHLFRRGSRTQPPTPMSIPDKKFELRFPLIKVVPCGNDSYLVLDSRAGMFYTLTKQQLHDILTLYDGGEISSEENKKLFGCMTKLGMFKQGSWLSTYPSTPDNIGELIRHNAENVLMRKFVIEVTQNCNFRCSYCNNTLETEWRHHTKKNISIENVYKAIDYYKKIYTAFLMKVPNDCRQKFMEAYEPSIGFYGGEPTMNWKAVTAGVEYFESLPWNEIGVKQDSMTITMNTNLSKMNQDMIDFLAKHNILLYASLDGPASEHDKNRLDVAGKPTFDRAYRNLMKIKDTNPGYFEKKVTIFAVQAPNHNQKLNHEFLDSLGCTISYLNMAPFGCFVDNPKAKSNEIKANMETYVHQAIDRYDADSEKELPDFTMFANMKVDNPSQGDVAYMIPTCPVGTDNLMVDVDGNFHICHKTDGSFIIGNVDKGLDTEALTRFYTKLIQDTDTAECRSCWALPFCGQCPAVRLHGGKFLNPTSEECDYFRNLYEIELRAFAGIYARHPDLMERLQEYVDDIEKYQGVMDLSKTKWERFLK